MYAHKSQPKEKPNGINWPKGLLKACQLQKRQPVFLREKDRLPIYIY